MTMQRMTRQRMAVQRPGRSKVPWRWLFFVGAGMIVVTIAWILALTGIFPGILATIVSAIFTASSFLLALFQFILPLLRQIQTEDVDLGLSPYQGAVVAPISPGGASLFLTEGFHEHPPEPEMAGCVSTYEINGRSSLAAIFPSLRPGNYTVFDSRQHMRKVTVHPNRPTVVDWRKLT